MHAPKMALVLLAALAMLAPAAPAAGEARSSEVVYVIPIRGMIEPALLYVVRRGVEEAQAVNARAVAFVMDTPGGTVEAASDIVRTIQGVDRPTYTFVEKNAFSAGAIIALSTKHIYMAPGSVIGDAMPILMTPFGGVQPLPEDLQEKTVSGVAALIRAAAEAGGHNKELAEKMVRREMELKIGNEVICPEGRLLTLTNQEAERKIGRDGGNLLSDGTVADVDEMLRQVGLGGLEIKEIQVTWAEHVARFVAALAPLFLIAGLLGIWIELKTPGFGLPGTLGILCLAVFFWGHHIAGLAGWEDILIFLLGIILLFIEVFLIPGFGVVGIAGIVLMLWAVLAAMIQHIPGGPWIPAWGDVQVPLLKLSSSLVATTVIGVLLGRYLPQTQLFGRLVLQQSTSRQEGFAASSDTRSLLGLEGRALSALRPAGDGLFGDRKLDVVTRGEFLAAGTPIRIVESHGNRIIVEAAGGASGRNE